MKPTIGTTSILDRQGMKRSDEAYLAGLLAKSATRFMLLADQKPVINSNAERTEATIRWLTRADIEKAGLPVTNDETLFLGVDRQSGIAHFAIGVTEHRTRNAPGVLEFLRPVVDLRTLAMQGVMSAEDLSIAGQAKALIQWHENARCCGHCGGTTLVKDGGWKRKCWACGLEHFPRTDPVVIMLVVDKKGNRCLLGHEARFAKEPKMYSTLAGFIEPGEDIDHAVQREVFEEAGIRVGEVRYHSTQPWPFPHSLMIGCIGYAETTDITIDPTEIEEARWFGVDEIKQMLAGKHPSNWWVPGKQAIARSLIKSFAEGKI
ncbi:MAG: NAD(+) diphosphatase [Hyphomicrobiaceae bacterium]|nr:NAD(+) diphosphatase [Hyphomicrobiaceae bacterium]